MSDPNDLLEEAWGIIANAGQGDWDRESAEWQRAAIRWRERYFATLPGMRQSSDPTRMNPPRREGDKDVR